MTIPVILKLEKREVELQVDNSFFQSISQIQQKARAVFEIANESLVEIKFHDDLERKLLTNNDLPSLVTRFSNSTTKNYLYITTTIAKSSTFDSSSYPKEVPKLISPTQSMNSFSRIGSFTTSASFQMDLQPKKFEFKLEIQLKSNENLLKFSSSLKSGEGYEDLMKLVRKYAELPNAEFEISYFELEDKLTLNKVSFESMMEFYETLDKSNRIIHAIEKSSSRSSISSISISQNSTSSTSLPSSTSSTQGTELNIILEETLSSQSSTKEENIHKIFLKELDTFSDLTKRIKSKIKCDNFDLKYLEDGAWYKISDDDSVGLMFKYLNTVESGKRRMRAIVTGARSSINVGAQFRPSFSKNGVSDGLVHPEAKKAQLKVSEEEFCSIVERSLQQKFQNVACLGEGGFSFVFKVSDNGKTKVVKVILNSSKSSDESTLNQALQEAMRANSLSHPNIVKIEYARINNDPTYLYMVMEYFPLGDLLKLMNQGTQLPETEVWRFIKQGALALEYLKQNKVVHRDIKPENFLQKDGTEGKIYVLSDFGLAKELENMRTHTKTNCSGTLGYIAPELLTQGSKDYSYASDMFAFGTTLFRILSLNMSTDIGTIAETNREETKLFERIQEKIRNRTGVYSKRLIELITKMVLYEPKDRITPEEVLKICDNTTKCSKCNKCKDSTCYSKGFSNCSCNNSVCRDCLEFYMEDSISKMNSSTVIRCMTCSQSLSESDIRKMVQPTTFETYLRIKNPPQSTTQKPQQNNPPQEPRLTQSPPLLSNSNTSSRIKHENIICDGCKQSDFTGIRWKCLDCPNYDLCNSCYQKKNTSSHKNHKFAKLEILDEKFEADLAAAGINMIVNDFQEAVQHLDKALRKYPLCEKALIMKARCEEKIGNAKTSKEVCEKILRECNAFCHEACELLGIIYLKHKNPTAAIPYLERANNIDSNSELCQYYLAMAYKLTDRYVKALHHARIAFNLKSDQSNSALLVELLIQNEEWTEGKLVTSLLLMKDPTNAELLYTLGLCEEKLGEYVESYQSFKAALSRKPFELKYKLAAARLSKLVTVGLLGALLQ
ncbi:CAMK family protein kinase [Naegleria gruberi]|uniref:non-specific serine/threonine protein kinase n=1 Tax=Naegleria gruberi TaxID=5762 RepID=D2VDN4_NAEGR|nr:CAMK family protein kinase [Naegleria gruberi]EFC45031.1 CAMK family protein kinase [Naegleria gruberi]|eukprot:XP_002677775.1 CAMK family protein kinase [Naegleria gruberi strain NEG-M]